MKPLTKNQTLVVKKAYHVCKGFQIESMLNNSSSASTDTDKKLLQQQYHLARLALLLRLPKNASTHLSRITDVVNLLNDNNDTNAAVLPKHIENFKVNITSLSLSLKMHQRKVLRKQKLNKILLFIKGLPMFNDLCSAYRKAIETLSTSTRDTRTLARIQDAFILELSCLLVDEDHISLIPPENEADGTQNENISDNDETKNVTQLGDGSVSLTFHQPCYGTNNSLKKHSMLVSNSTLIKDIIDSLEIITKVPKENIRLIQAGKKLTLTKTIHEHKIRDGDIITIVTSSRSLSNKTRYCQKPRSEDERTIFVNNIRKLIKKTGKHYNYNHKYSKSVRTN